MLDKTTTKQVIVFAVASLIGAALVIILGPLLNRLPKIGG